MYLMRELIKTSKQFKILKRSYLSDELTHIIDFFKYSLCGCWSVTFSNIIVSHVIRKGCWSV
jgi:hypothetical protein